MTAQEIGQLLIAHDALAEEEHDDHDDDGDDRHAEAVLEEARRRDAEELAGIQTAQQPLERRDVEEAREHAAGDGADAADDDQQQYLIGHAASERHRLHRAHVHRQHTAADAREERGNDEGKALVVGKIDAHRLGGDLVVADGFERAAVSGVHQQHNARDEHADEQQVRGRAAEIGIALEKVRGVGQRTDGVPLDNGAHDLGKAEGRNGEVVALQTQNGQTDQIGEERRDQTADKQREDHADRRADLVTEEAREDLRQGELHDTAVKILVYARALGDRDAQHRVGIRAEEHKARLTEGEKARKAVEQVHRNGDEGIDRRLFDDLDHNVIARELGVEDHRDRQHDEQDERGEEILFADRFLFHLHPSLHLVRDLFAEQSRGLDAQHDDQQRKGERIGEGRLAEALDDLLAKADQERADHRAGNGADAAEHCRDEGLQAGHTAGGDRHRGIVRKVEHRADRGEERTDDKGHGNDGIDLHAHELRRLKILGGGTHSHADLGLFDERDERKDERDGQKRRHDRDALGGRAEERDGVGDPRDRRLDRLRQAAGQVERKILDEVAHTDGADHQRHTRRRAQRLIGHALDGKAENDGEDEHQRDRNVHGHGRGGVDHDQACHHKDIAVGKVNEAQNAVDQRVADGDERVLTSHRDTADQIR